MIPKKPSLSGRRGFPLHNLARVKNNFKSEHLILELKVIQYLVSLHRIVEIMQYQFITFVTGVPLLLCEHNALGS